VKLTVESTKKKSVRSAVQKFFASGSMMRMSVTVLLQQRRLLYIFNKMFESKNYHMDLGELRQ